jgi:hypothetical protein
VPTDTGMKAIESGLSNYETIKPISEGPTCLLWNDKARGKDKTYF